MEFMSCSIQQNQDNTTNVCSKMRTIREQAFRLMYDLINCLEQGKYVQPKLRGTLDALFDSFRACSFR